MLPFFLKLSTSLNAPTAIGFFKSSHDLSHWNIRETSVKFEILHELPVLGIVGLENRILPAVEFERRHAVFPAELLVKGRCRLHPLPFKEKLGKSMVGEDVRAEKFQQLPRCKVIAYGRKTGAGRDCSCSAQRAKQRGFGYKNRGRLSRYC